MKKLAVILVFLLSTNLFSQSNVENVDKNLEDSRIPDQLLAIVTSIIQGDDDSQFKMNISPGAYLINNKTYENMFDVLSDPEKKSNLVETKETEVQYLSLRVPDDLNSAYLVIETKSKVKNVHNWHSVSFKLSKDNTWVIVGWHKS